MKKTLLSILFCTSLLSFIACNSNNETSNNKASETTAINFKSWAIEEIEGKPTIEKTPNDGMGTTGKPFIEFDFERKNINAFAGCNNISGKFEISGNQIKFSSIGRNVMGCAKDLMSQEYIFLKFIEVANRFETQGNNLNIYSDNKLGLKLVVKNK